MRTVQHLRLTKMTVEVNEFHPLLSRLLPNLPTVKRVEYTHGQNELGADFIVTVQNPVFDTEEYVGIIAKIGKIVQNQADIERQIEECEIQRPLGGGKRRSRLDEIWIFATGSITKNAQERIYEKYKSNKIKFIPGTDIEKLIDQHIPDFWTNIDIEVGESLQAIRKRNESLDRNLSLVKGADIYVEQDIVRLSDENYSLKKRATQKATKVEFTTEVLNHQFLLVEGSMGSGESVIFFV